MLIIKQKKKWKAQKFSFVWNINICKYMTVKWHEPNTTVTSLSTLTYRQFANIPLCSTYSISQWIGFNLTGKMINLSFSYIFNNNKKKLLFCLLKRIVRTMAPSTYWTCTRKKICTAASLIIFFFFFTRVSTFIILLISVKCNGKVRMVVLTYYNGK